jgi:hypothetical protein
MRIEQSQRLAKKSSAERAATLQMDKIFRGFIEVGEFVFEKRLQGSARGT